jgi:Skp family chaperone for outer membrane proteins
MKRTVYAAFAALFLGSFAASNLFSGPQQAPVQLGFLDVNKAFSEYRKFNDIGVKMKAKVEAIQQALKQRQAQIEQSASKLDTLNQDSDEYQALLRQVQIDRYTLDLDKKAEQNKLDAELNRQRALIYKEITFEAQSYGAEHGLAAVLLYEPPDEDLGTMRDLGLYMGTRTVLCRDESLDVTKDVVTRLNALLPPASSAPPTSPPIAPDPKNAPPAGSDPSDPKKPK